MTVHGVRVYNEQDVQPSRIQAVTHDEATQVPPERRKSVGRLIQIAINDLKKDIREAKHLQQVKQLPPDRGSEHALESVGAIVDRLRADGDGFDLLADERELVNFIFRNSTLLKTTWLQVVDSIRYGTQSSNTSKQEQNPPVLPPAASDFFSKEFGFDQRRGNCKRIVKPMPERASAIEKRMTELGFQHTTGANVREDRQTSHAIEGSQRPETTKSVGMEREVGNMDRAAQDDSALDDLGKRIRTSQDIHRFIYELKVGLFSQTKRSPTHVLTRWHCRHRHFQGNADARR